MKQILLPNNAFGTIIMLFAILLVILVPLSVTGWLVSLVAPWWVAAPCALLVSLVIFLRVVKFNK
jgi:hypothetical protein